MLKINDDEIKLVISDFDGTLRHGEMGAMIPKNIEVINKLMKEGVDFIINTGNAPVDMKDVISQIHPINEENKYIIGSNGNIIYNYLTDEYTVNTTFTNEELNRIVNEFKDMDLDYQITSDDLNTTYYSSQKFLEWGAQHTSSKEPLKGRTLITEEVLKNSVAVPKITFNFIKLEDKPKVIEILNERFKDIDLTVTWWQVDGIDLSIGKPNKYSGIISLLEVINEKEGKDITLDNVVYFGDQHNDLSVFENLKYAIAVGNAVDEVKKHAYAITDDAKDAGVANYLLSIYQ